MTKSELISEIASETNVSKVSVEAVLTTFVKTVTKSVKKGEKVSLPGLGSFEKTKREARVGKNPRTGEVVKIPAKNVAKFKVSKTLKDAIA